MPAKDKDSPVVRKLLRSIEQLTNPSVVEQMQREIERLTNPSVVEQMQREIERLLSDEGDPLPSPAPAEGKARRKLGAHGSTLDRVKEARGLVEAGMPKTKACKRAKIDTRTYDRYVEEFVNWGDDEKS